jgi:hypothetical protein
VIDEVGRVGLFSIAVKRYRRWFRCTMWIFFLDLAMGWMAYGIIRDAT